MKRVGFKMYLKEGAIDEYKRRHDTLWPELKALLKANGIADYSIYHDQEANVLFSTQVLHGDSSSQDFGQNEIIKKWWAYMADLMMVNDDQSPVSTPLKEVFYLM